MFLQGYRNGIISVAAICMVSVVIGCAGPVPRRAETPKGNGWIVYSQSYNHLAQSSSSNGNGQTTTTTSSRHDFLEGTPLNSTEKAVFEGFNNVRDCKFAKKAGEK